MPVRHRRNFNPRSPCGERRFIFYQLCKQLHFNPRSPCGERPTELCAKSGHYKNFNPRSPCGERPDTSGPCTRTRYFNPRSPCGERLCPCPVRQHRAGISIHAPRVGSDLPGIRFWRLLWNFNPRSPCGERRTCLPHSLPLGNFNPRSPCGERRGPTGKKGRR